MKLQEAHNLDLHREEEIESRRPRSQTVILIEPCETACQTCARPGVQNPFLPMRPKGM